MFGVVRLASLLLLFAALVVPGSGAEAVSVGRASAEAGEVVQIDAAAYQQMLDEATVEKGGAQSEEGNTLRVELSAESTVLFFTKADHPAHPSVISVTVRREEGVPHILTDGWRGGDRRAFDDWFTAFVRRNAGIVRQWQRNN